MYTDVKIIDSKTSTSCTNVVENDVIVDLATGNFNCIHSTHDFVQIMCSKAYFPWWYISTEKHSIKQILVVILKTNVDTNTGRVQFFQFFPYIDSFDSFQSFGNEHLCRCNVATNNFNRLLDITDVGRNPGHIEESKESKE